MNHIRKYTQVQLFEQDYDYIYGLSDDRLLGKFAELSDALEYVKKEFNLVHKKFPEDSISWDEFQTEVTFERSKQNDYSDVIFTIPHDLSYPLKTDGSDGDYLPIATAAYFQNKIHYFVIFK